MGKPKNNWREKVTAYRASGQSQKEWCAQNNVSIHSLKFWLKKEKINPLPKETCKWIPLNIKETETAFENQTLILKVGQVFIEVKPGFNSELLTDVIKTLVSIC